MAIADGARPRYDRPIMADIGRWLVIAGLGLAAMGGVLMLVGRLPIGELPGDITIGGPNGSVFIPLATCLLLSAVLTLALNLIIRR